MGYIAPNPDGAGHPSRLEAGMLRDPFGLIIGGGERESIRDGHLGGERIRFI